MTRRGYRQYCAVATALDVLGERWTLLIVRDLLLGPRRFGELAAQLPAAGTDLVTARLRLLTEHGIVERNEVGGVGGPVEYRLTDVGQGLRPLIEELAFVGLQWMTRPEDSPNKPNLQYALATARNRLDPSKCPTGSCDVTGTTSSYRLHNDGSVVTLRYRSSGPSGLATTISGNDLAILAVLTGRADIESAGIEVHGPRRSGERWLRALAKAIPAPIAAD